MDVFDSNHICNHTDETGLYSYKVCIQILAACIILTVPFSFFAIESTKNDVSSKPTVPGRSILTLVNRIFALRALLDALAPLIGAEAEAKGKVITEGWAKDASEQKIKAWTDKGKELGDEVVRVIQETMSVEYGRLMRNVRSNIKLRGRNGLRAFFSFSFFIASWSKKT